MCQLYFNNLYYIFYLNINEIMTFNNITYNYQNI